MTNLIFFYGTLLSGFQRPGGARLSQNLTLVGRGSIEARLFDLGLYPAAIPAGGSTVWGEVHQMLDVELVLTVFDNFEGFSVTEPDTSLFKRHEVPVAMLGSGRVLAWAYFYNRPLDSASLIESGDYMKYLEQNTASRPGDSGSLG